MYVPLYCLRINTHVLSKYHALHSLLYRATKISQFSNNNVIVNDIVNDKKSHNIVNDSIAHKSDGLLVAYTYVLN